MKVNAIIQARCGSTRFPNKVFAVINGKPLIWHVVDRLTYTKSIDKIVIATTTNTKDDCIEEWCKANKIAYFRGSEDDVLNRYCMANLAFPSDVIVRITADDPFKEPSVVDMVVNKLINGRYDLVTNNFPPSFPEGLDCEAFFAKSLHVVEQSTKDTFEREHVTQYFYHNPNRFSIGNVSSDRQLSYLRWTIDKDADLDMVRKIYASREPNKGGILLLDEILDIIEKHPEIMRINSAVERSAMYK